MKKQDCQWRNQRRSAHASQGVLYLQNFLRFHSIAGLHPQSPCRFTCQPLMQVSQYLRPPYPSHMIADAA